ncbi:MAG TPA: zf-HC2 domain-containing protein [Albitalea sp.]|nr:zf-HC2 domain-containing protein [Albitalea sp.]
MNRPISDEMLFAYVDGELDAAARAEVEAAIAADAALAQRVEQQRSLRTLLGAAYRPVLEEAVPARLQDAANAPSAPTRQARVLDLAAARKARRAAPAPHGWNWQHWGGMAACLLVGVIAGRSAWLAQMTDNIATQDGRLVAHGRLAQALSTQLASTQPGDAPVRIGLSFVSRGDEYCRSFTLPSSGTGGLACRQGKDWTLRVLAQEQAAGAQGMQGDRLRMASSPIAPAVLKTIEEQMQGGPLDAQAERAAAIKDWRR